jgi:aryl-alcohol dehydrogenase-like predicted oxidoreductase
MRYRRLGSSDLEVSEISLGSWLTFASGVGFEQTRACTDAGFKVGINFFDTADVYGRGAAESVWGEILSGRPRDSYVLTTKVWGQISEDPADRACSTFTGHAPTITNPVKPALCRGSGHVPDGPPHRSTLDPTASEDSV